MHMFTVKWIILGFLFLPPITFASRIRVLSSGKDVASHKEGSGAKLLHPSLVGQESLTFCARFNVYQLFYQGYHKPGQAHLMLGGHSLLVSAAMKEERNDYKTMAGVDWKNGDVGFLYEYGVPDETLIKANWTPGVWNSACFVLNNRREKKQNQVWFNGEILKEYNNIDSNLKEDENKSLILMGYLKDGKYYQSMFGAMTDVNIWNSALQQSKVGQWSRCELGVGGNLLDWAGARLDTQGLKQTQVDKSVVCQRKQYDTRLMVFQEKRGVVHKYC